MRRLADAGRSTRDQSSFHLISILVTRIIDMKKKLFFVCNICLITTNVTDVEEIWQSPAPASACQDSKGRAHSRSYQE